MSEDIKEKILNKALDLFNIFGYESVKMRDISGALNISPGNLTYHYKKKDDIIYAIVQQQCKDHESRKCTEKMTFEEFNNLLKANVEHQKKYFFYFNNITELPRKYPEIAKIQIEVKRDFYNLLTRFFKNLTVMGLMKPELIEGAYDDLAFAIISIVVFWTQENFLQNDFVLNPKNLLSVVWNIIRPNLTERGIQLIPNNENL
ncbi:TetR/AcrR family transcriptional regulator [Lacrimispora sp. 38-1]|uniref:TetR/AcrR family transcriptional regulator n=1 Tax=Lacrimispora sp. 38-1 TaxID=3125778 RepID=UPI003CE8F056